MRLNYQESINCKEYPNWHSPKTPKKIFKRLPPGKYNFQNPGPLCR